VKIWWRQVMDLWIHPTVWFIFASEADLSLVDKFDLAISN
jgi:hypothetical protein